MTTIRTITKQTDIAFLGLFIGIPLLLVAIDAFAGLSDDDVLT